MPWLPWQSGVHIQYRKLKNKYICVQIKNKCYINLKETMQIFHPISRQCLDSDAETKEIFMNPCSIDSKTQKWQFEKINEDLIRKDFKF
jgi:hypothetical protein